jgi:hypothetical protein
MRTRVPTVRLYVLACLLGINSLPSFSQSISAGNIEAGIGIGPSFFLGDLGGNRGKGKTFIKDVNFPVTKLMKGIYLNYYPAEWFGFRIAANIGVLEGYDSLVSTDGKDELERKKRNLGFRSNIKEVYAAIEIYPTVFMEQYDGLLGKIRPYGVAGFGMFKHNPKAIYTEPNGTKRWVELKPLRLEGQGMAEYPNKKEYSLNQYALIMGGGFKYYIKENMYIGLEILHRKTFTDYLDDVSTTYIDPQYFDVYLTPDQAAQARQLAYRERYYNPAINRPYINYQRGDPKENDAFFSGMLRFGMRLGADDSPNARARKQLRCPVFY